MPTFELDPKVPMIVARRLGLDASEILAGSLVVEAGPGGRETARWQGFRALEPGFMQRVLDEAAGLPVCRVCGCTDNAACSPPCSWAEPDRCTSCPS